MIDLYDLYARHSAQDSDGREDCDHERAASTHVGGSGTHAIYVWVCPDCGMRETGGYEP